MIKDYDLVIDYHPGKANVIANALSQKSYVTLAHIRNAYVLLLLDMKTLRVSLDYDGYGALATSFVVRPTLVDQIRGKVCVPDIDDLKRAIMEKTHYSAYAIHLGSTRCI